LTLSARRKPIFEINRDRDCKEDAKEVAKTVRFWFRRKYSLPPADPRYLDMTEEGMLTEYWAHYYYDKPDSEWEEDTDNFDEEVAAMDAEMGIPPDDDFEDISNG